MQLTIAFSALLASLHAAQIVAAAVVPAQAAFAGDQAVHRVHKRALARRHHYDTLPVHIHSAGHHRHHDQLIYIGHHRSRHTTILVNDKRDYHPQVRTMLGIDGNQTLYPISNGAAPHVARHDDEYVYDDADVVEFEDDYEPEYVDEVAYVDVDEHDHYDHAHDVDIEARGLLDVLTGVLDGVVGIVSPDVAKTLHGLLDSLLGPLLGGLNLASMPDDQSRRAFYVSNTTTPTPVQLRSQNGTILNDGSRLVQLVLPGVNSTVKYCAEFSTGSGAPSTLTAGPCASGSGAKARQQSFSYNTASGVLKPLVDGYEVLDGEDSSATTTTATVSSSSAPVESTGVAAESTVQSPCDMADNIMENGDVAPADQMVLVFQPKVKPIQKLVTLEESTPDLAVTTVTVTETETVVAPTETALPFVLEDVEDVEDVEDPAMTSPPIDGEIPTATSTVAEATETPETPLVVSPEDALLRTKGGAFKLDISVSKDV